MNPYKKNKSKQKPGNKVVVGMSGGVDSSVALILLKKMGYEPVGVSLNLPVWDKDTGWDKKNQSDTSSENTCYTKESFKIAKGVCDKIGVEHHIIDAKQDFRDIVIDYFISELKSGKTPNPCVICNRYLKFPSLLRFADQNDIYFVATGHYAVIDKTEGLKKEFKLNKPKDTKKDQTYGLFYLNQDMLSRILLPLGNLNKKDVFSIAEKEGFPVFSGLKESQDLCFVSKKDQSEFIKKNIGHNKGDIFDEAKNKIGEHKGSYLFTIGQKKGLNLPGSYFVKEKEMNNLIVTEDKKKTGGKEVFLEDVNFISDKIPERNKIINAKIRYGQKESKAILSYSDKSFKVIFDEHKDSITPGQFCVLYNDDNECIGGGKIL